MKAGGWIGIGVASVVGATALGVIVYRRIQQQKIAALAETLRKDPGLLRRAEPIAETLRLVEAFSVKPERPQDAAPILFANRGVGTGGADTGVVQDTARRLISVAGLRVSAR